MYIKRSAILLFAVIEWSKKEANMQFQQTLQNKLWITVFLALAFLTSTTARAAAGDVDLSFGNANIPAFSTVSKSVIQPDGKIVIGGRFTAVDGTSRIGIARLNADGTLDPTFASPFSSAQVNALALQPDGKILLGGILNLGGLTKNLTRVNIDGSIDTSFNVNPNDVFGIVGQIAIQNGTIYVSGAFSGVTLLNSDGSLKHVLVPGYSTPKFAVQPDGSVIFAVPYSGGSFVTRILDIQFDPVVYPTSWGVADNSFSTVFFDRDIVSLTLQADGKVIVCGNFQTVNGAPLVHMARLMTDGSVDPTFDAGMAIVGFPRDAIMQPDGKLIVVGTFSLPGETLRRGFARLNTDGSDDPTFLVPLPDRNTESLVNSAALQPDGKIIITGDFTSIGSIPRTYVARLNGDDSTPPPTPTPTPTPTPSPSPAGNTPIGSNVAVQLGGIEVNFDSITAAGNTTAIPGNPVIPLPAGYSIFRDLSYDITTTATGAGLITISFDLNSLIVPGNPVTPQVFSRLRVLHGENGVFVDRTIPGNPVVPGNPVLVGRVSSLSPFVIGLLNDAPTLDPIAAQTVVQGDTVSLIAIGNDIDEEQTLTYSLLGNAYGATIQPASGAFSWTPGAGQVGPFIFTINVSDNGVPVLAAQQQFTVNVTANPAYALPNAPTNLAATAVSKSQINLTWTDTSNNENGFSIERCTPKGKNCIFSQITQVGANVTTFSNTGLSKGAEYRYRVRAFNATGNSAYTNIAIAKTPAR